MKKLTTKRKFQIGAASILVLSGVIVSVVAYVYLKKSATADIYRETEIFISAADATRTYVKDVLRPTVGPLLPTDSFIPHAMSTSFVGREIMGRLKQRFPNFLYKRAAGNPTNPINQADEFELSMLKWFGENRDTNEWHGLIKKNNHSYYTRLRAIYAETQCLYCHGDPADAPQAMKAAYTSGGGFGYQVGDVVAADTIYIPVDVTFVKIKEAAWLIFLIGTTSLFLLMGLFYLLFNRTVVSDLKGTLEKLRNISGTQRSVSDKSTIETKDEFEQLKGALGEVATELKQTHDDLKASEYKYRLLYETSRDAILIFNKDNGLQDINEAGLKLFGFKDRAEALSIETFFQLFWDTRDAKFFLAEVKKNGFVQGQEISMVNRSGNRLAVMISATVRLDEKDLFDGIDATFRDVTEKRRLEKYLAQTEKLASIGQLASGVAHEINNPLGVIKCYSNLIAKGQTPDTQVSQDVKIIQKHTDQCKSVVEALLNFARKSPPKMLEADIHQIIEEVLSVLERQTLKEQITVYKEFDRTAPRLTLDPQKIQQVLMNLLLNARQAIKGPGEIRVRTGIRPGTNLLAIELIDTGQGISEKIIDRIFDPFFTTKDPGQGTGLGLSVSYGIVKQHGGEIEIVSKPGKGSTFTVLLPVDNSGSVLGADHD
jgi:PAS domain S-box-containing protein